MSDVQEGYKQTEVGVIPQEWEVKTLGDCLLKKPEYGINAAAVPYSDNLPVYIRITDISEDGKFLPEKKTSVSNINSNNYFLEKDDIVFARTGASTGKTYLYNSKDGELVFAGFLIRIKVNPNELNAQYLKSYTETGAYRNWVKIMSMRSGQPGINGNEYAQLQIPCPPLPEQTAIASALSDVDALITALEQLITKKRNIKQGAMKELLKPKEGWEVKLLKEVVDNFIDYRGVTPKKLGMEWGNGNIPALSANNVQMGYIDFEKECYYGSEELYKKWMRNGDCGKDDVVITMEAPLGNIAYIPDDKKYILSQRTVLLKSSDLMDKVFLRFYLMNSDFQKKLLEKASGSTAQGIQRKTFEKLEIAFPVNKNEQTAIATILSDMDAEIEALEEKQDKYKALKQGMMQELLTGKTRLIKENKV
ncbi:MAG: restriction endonuclease subunit S [Candidatus Methanoperedens sp.]|nr:restriction endonuclease subunit S [Candidatus Methanoperedens sp.]